MCSVPTGTANPNPPMFLARLPIVFTRLASTLPLFVLLLATTVFAAEPAPRRVGDWDIDRRAVFAVAAAPKGRDLHFVYAEGRQLHHAHSADGGVTWSVAQPVASGSAPELAVDRTGAVHLVYEAVGTPRIEYRRFVRGAWSPPIAITASVPGKEAQMLAPRIAVDGANHVHVIYWTFGKDKKVWPPSCPTVSSPLPHGVPDFEPPILWGQREGGDGRHGTLAVDPAGDVHVFYATHRPNAHFMEHRIRHRDGTWGRHDVWRGHLVADWCIGAAVTGDGVAHVTVQSRLNDGLHVFHASNRTDPAVRTLEHDFGPENFETVTQLLATPDGDLWFAAGHLEPAEENAQNKPAHARPNLATWARRSHASGSWSERTAVSPTGAINIDTRRGNHPRLVLVDGQVCIFYAEQRPGEKWRHWQRVLGP